MIVGKLEACVPTVFRVELLEDINANLVTEENPNGKLTIQMVVDALGGFCKSSTLWQEVLHHNLTLLNLPA